MSLIEGDLKTCFDESSTVQSVSDQNRTDLQIFYMDMLASPVIMNDSEVDVVRSIAELQSVLEGADIRWPTCVVRGHEDHRMLCREIDTEFFWCCEFEDRSIVALGNLRHNAMTVDIHEETLSKTRTRIKIILAILQAGERWLELSRMLEAVESTEDARSLVCEVFGLTDYLAGYVLSLRQMDVLPEQMASYREELRKMEDRLRQ